MDSGAPIPALGHAGWYVAEVLAKAAEYRGAAELASWRPIAGGEDATAGLEGVHTTIARLCRVLVAATPGRQYVMSGLRPGDPKLHGRGNAVDIGSHDAIAPGPPNALAPDLGRIALPARAILGHPPQVVGVTDSPHGEVLWMRLCFGSHLHSVHGPIRGWRWPDEPVAFDECRARAGEVAAIGAEAPRQSPAGAPHHPGRLGQRGGAGGATQRLGRADPMRAIVRPLRLCARRLPGLFIAGRA